MSELLFEIGCEEIPAGYILPALEALARQVESALGEARLSFGETRTFGTPRRLALAVAAVAERQSDQEVKRLGPPKGAAFDSEGRPTKAALGFAKGQGVAMEDLTIEATPKGEYVCARRHEKGRPAAEVLPEILLKLVPALPFPKSMRWGAGRLRFARPIHWLLATLGGQPLTFELDGIVSGGVTYGHRFVSPGPIEPRGAEDYLARLEAAKVIAEPARRREMCRRAVLDAAREAGGAPISDDALLEQVTNLVEFPVAVCGRFDDEFLQIPREVVVTAMREHQRYFAVTDAGGALLPAFVSVVNTPASDMSLIRAGNERVLRARLADARFFYREDCKRPLHARLDTLRKVVFHSGLGTSFEKVKRLEELAGLLADRLYPGHKQAARRAALLSKCDLVTEMVGEFPTLQGTMGGIYARGSGETEEVAQAIAEHYLPKGAQEEVPKTEAGVVVSLADKLDNICGVFGLGLVPTGTADPYALRRQCLAVITLCWAKGLHLDLREAIRADLARLSPKLSTDPAETEAPFWSSSRAAWRACSRPLVFLRPGWCRPPSRSSRETSWRSGSARRPLKR
ncbi:MAG: glycine--tRNA ligase subunit beta [Pseudomonadota bacterium]